MQQAPRAIRWQFLAATLVSAGFLVAILVWDQTRVTQRIFYAQATEAARLNARAVSALAVEALETHDLPALRKRLRRVTRSPDIAYIDLLDKNRRTLASYTNTDLRDAGVPASRNQAREVLFDVQIPLESNGRTLGALRIGTNVAGLKAEMDGLISRGIGLGFALLLAVAGIAWWFGHLLGGRLWSLTEAIRHLGSGSGTIPMGGNDEVAFLAKTFNDLNRKLDAERLERRKVEKFKDDMVHMLVHDLKNPLTTLSLLSWSLTKETEDGKPDKKNLELLERNVLQLEEMVRGILDVAKMQKMQSVLKKETLHPAVLVEDCISDYRLQADAKGLRLSGEAAPGLPPVQGDPEILRRVLGNLVSNALSHTPQGGGVRVSALPDPSGLLFAVSDDGAGIAEEDKKRIFEKFVQGKQPTAKGSGLGLAFCRMALELHGGKIWVESAVGKGSTFYFTLPGSPVAPADELPPYPGDQPSKSHKKSKVPQGQEELPLA